MLTLPSVTMRSMNTQIYDLGITAASTIWANPLTLVGLIALVLGIVIGLAGRLAILCEDFRYTRFFSRNR
jgi:hypothetical protein